MAIKQHHGALQLLSIIRQFDNRGALLTYQVAAQKLGRPKNHARAVAQMCDLLDAAAAYAGAPLLALVKVREKSRAINWKAFLNEQYRDEIIACSMQHKFSDSDYRAIEKSMKKLQGLGNKASWDLVNKEIPRDELRRRLTMTAATGFLDAIDDLGTDQPPAYSHTTVSYVRDKAIRDGVKARANGKCEYCGELGFVANDGTRYLECHHIIALANDGADRMSNVIALCPRDHREAHYGARREQLEKEMISIVKGLVTPSP